MSTLEEHDNGICQGVWGACPWCDAALDEQRARRIKEEMNRSVRKPDYSSVATESAE